MTIRAIFDGALLLLSIVASVPVALLCVQLAAAKSRQGRLSDPGESAGGRMRTIAVVMPAHDEAAGIEPSVRAVLAELGPGDRLLVVADNCTDSTAELARALGAETIERRDAQRRGKGYALDFGVRWLERDPPHVAMIVDADCIVAPGSLARLATAAMTTARPVQALYAMQAPAGAPLRTRIAEFAWIVKNKVRPMGCAALGWPCQLMGTGMAFPWPLLRDASLASGHLVEDMQLGLDLAAAGTSPLFCPLARVSSTFPLDTAGAQSQRARWEHGHLSVIAAVGPRLLWRAIRQRDSMLLAMVLDVAVPPLAALALGLSALLLLDAAAWASGGAVGPFALSAGTMLVLVASLFRAWSEHGRGSITLGELAALPLYVAAKVPLYVRMFTKRQVEWVRTKRDDRNR